MSWAGRLRHQVTIQNYSESQDSTTGEVTKSWTEFATVRAAIEPLRGKEFFESQERFGVTMHRVIIRYLAGVNDTMRVKFGSRILAIKAVLNKDERNRWLELMCEEGPQDG